MTDLARLILERDRTALGRAITLVESTCDDDIAASEQLLVELHPPTGGATRVGVTGTPGVGKAH